MPNRKLQPTTHAQVNMPNTLLSVLRHSFAAFLSLFILFSVIGLTTAKADVQYLYDETDRLVGVVDGVGASALYQYDKAGNIMAIRRFASGDLAIADFTPDTGPIGTAVTIYGVGFSATAASNTVKFNGVTASVSSATTTKLVATVPTGATTGAISVTVGIKTATSLDPFTVTTGSVNAPPVITAITPIIGVIGSTFTITGQNFDANPLNNNVRFIGNFTRAAISSNTQATIATSVPAGAISGKVSVRTPMGLAISSQDFFIPPIGYTADQVGYTGRIAVDGAPLAVNTGIAGKIGIVVFDGVKDKGLGLAFTTVTGSATIQILKPDGGYLVYSTPVGSPNGSLDINPLPTTGTYTILILPGTTSSLSATMTLTSDVTATLTANGAAQAFTSVRPGQNARYTFNATAGQNLSLLFSGDTFPGYTYIWVNKPDGTYVSYAFPQYSGTGPGMNGIIPLANLPVTGTYTVFVAPSDAATGTVSLRLLADAVVAPVVDSTASPVSLLAGQNGRHTFTGVAGKGYGISLTSIATTPAGGSLQATVYKPDGTYWMACSFSGSNYGTCDLPPLPVAGTYTVVVYPGTYAATYSLWLSSDAAATLTANGAAQAFTSVRPGQNARYTFSATAGQNLSLLFSGDTFPGYTYIWVNKPDGTYVTYAYPNYTSGAGLSGTLPLANLPVTGTYTVYVNPTGIATGTVQLTLQ